MRPTSATIQWSALKTSTVSAPMMRKYVDSSIGHLHAEGGT